jgi:hypothetical protein
MVNESKECTDIKVDVGVLQNQVLTLSALCAKMDTVIEKLMDQQQRYIEKVYNDMEKRKMETEADVRELHGRIDTVLDKLQDSELRITDEIKSLREHMLLHNQQEKDGFAKLNEWKWMVIGGCLVLGWAISNLDILQFLKSFK